MEWEGLEHVLNTSRVTPGTATKSQRIYSKPAQSRLPRRCLLFRSRDLNKRLGCQLTGSSRDRDMASVFVLDELSSFEDQIRGWLVLVLFEGDSKGGFIEGGRERAKNDWEQ